MIIVPQICTTTKGKVRRVSNGKHTHYSYLYNQNIVGETMQNYDMPRGRIINENRLLITLANEIAKTILRKHLITLVLVHPQLKVSYKWENSHFKVDGYGITDQKS